MSAIALQFLPQSAAFILRDEQNQLHIKSLEFGVWSSELFFHFNFIVIII